MVHSKVTISSQLSYAGAHSVRNCTIEYYSNAKENENRKGKVGIRNNHSE